MTPPNDAPFTAVIVGGDVGAYSLARAFYEQYGVRAYLISEHDTWIVRYSKILHHVRCPAPAEPDVLYETLTSEPFAGIARDGRPILVMGSADRTVQAIISLHGKLPDNYIGPYVDQERFDRGTMKQNFSELCQKLGIDHPATQILDLSQEPPADLSVPFDYPVMVKPGNVTAWKKIDFPGRKKVHEVSSETELRELTATMYRAGYRENVILQDKVPGNDQGMRTLTCYCDKNSDVRFASWGVTLLEEHTPGAIGNPVAMVTSHHPEVVEQSRLILKELGWVGYANFDVKKDPRDGSMKFFELNPRLGRSNFYITGGGHNAASWYVDEYVFDTLKDQAELVQDQLESCFTVIPQKLLLHYITDPSMKAWVKGIFKRGGGRNPLWNRAETDPRRWALIAIAQANYVKKFFKYYKVTE
ncbi:carboxylate--amine ligase [Spelaeicoccus albus]|uniref:D-aspartate ligase n=1 Tax=Spelaeicoccus albus TaxID=1280376 RepID=A0A7Z0D187_9MICO|nr:hypothetical protein [Spelaeicoccus albus]NYI66563.1 D-aspartate ligase [Spelaeicoccus albus]